MTHLVIRRSNTVLNRKQKGSTVRSLRVVAEWYFSGLGAHLEIFFYIKWQKFRGIRTDIPLFFQFD